MSVIATTHRVDVALAAPPARRSFTSACRASIVEATTSRCAPKGLLLNHNRRGQPKQSAQQLGRTVAVLLHRPARAVARITGQDRLDDAAVLGVGVVEVAPR